MQIAYIHAGLTSRLHLYLEGHGDKQFFFCFLFLRMLYMESYVYDVYSHILFL